MQFSITMVTSTNEPTAVMHPEVAMEIGGAALTWIGATANDNRAAQATLGTQRVVYAKIKVRPNGAGVCHCPEAPRVSANLGLLLLLLYRGGRGSSNLVQVIIVVLVWLLLHRRLGLLARND